MKNQVIENPVSPDELILCLETCIKARICPMVWGAMGIGKTEIIKTFAKGLKKIIGKEGYLVVIPPGFDPLDLYGMPVPDLKKKLAVWLLPRIWHEVNEAEKSGKFVVLFIDEINTGSQALLNALMGLINEGRIGEYIRPENSWCVAAGNRQHADRSSVVRLTGPMTSRLVHFDLYPDSEQWYHGYAIPNRLKSEISIYVKRHPDSIFRFDPRKDERGFPNPRSWKMVSDILRTDPSEKIRYMLIAGKIGAEEATRYLAFESFLKHIIPISEIKSNPKSCRLPDMTNGDGLTSCFYLATALASQCKSKKETTTFCQYMKRLPGEFGALFCRNLLTLQPDVENAAFVELQLQIKNG